MTAPKPVSQPRKKVLAQTIGQTEQVCRFGVEGQRTAMFAPEGYVSVRELLGRAHEVVAKRAWDVPPPSFDGRNSIAASGQWYEHVQRFQHGLASLLLYEFLRIHSSKLALWALGHQVLRVQPHILDLSGEEPDETLREVKPENLFEFVRHAGFDQDGCYLYLDQTDWTVKHLSHGEVDRYVDAGLAQVSDLRNLQRLAGYGLFLSTGIDSSPKQFEALLPPDRITTRDSHAITTRMRAEAERRLTAHLREMQDQGLTFPRKRELFAWYEETFHFALTGRAQGDVWKKLTGAFPALRRPGRPPKT